MQKGFRKIIIKSICCMNGQVNLPPLPPPPTILKDLLTQNTAEAKHFRKNIRAFNSSLAFASLGVKEIAFPHGVYCFRIQGQAYHKIGPLLPEDNSKPAFAQIYVHGTDNELTNRCSWNSGLNIGIMHLTQTDIRERT